MKSRLVTSMTLLATLLHSVLGCCWHHEHAGEEIALSSPAAIREAVHAPRCCHTPAPAPEEHSPDLPASPQEDCGESHCVYVTSRSQDSSDHDLALSLECPATTAVVLPPLVELVRPNIFRSPPLSSSASQWRARLQVWLV